MRRILLIAALVVFGTAGVAYGATVITNVYVLTGKASPVKSGTKAHPKPTGVTLAYSVTTKPKGDRPNVVKTLVISIADTQAHTNAFPTCSTSRLNKTGPKTCPAGSRVGTGYFIGEVGLAGHQSGSQLLTCRVELSVYNGGGNSLSYYVYPGTANAHDCPSSELSPTAFAAHLKEVGTTLVQTVNTPFSVRHPNNNSALDAAAITSSITIPVKSRKVKGKTVGFGETTGCPANHKRHVSIKFILENGKAQTATANLACK